MNPGRMYETTAQEVLRRPKKVFVWWDYENCWCHEHEDVSSALHTINESIDTALGYQIQKDIYLYACADRLHFKAREDMQDNGVKIMDVPTKAKMESVDKRIIADIALTMADLIDNSQIAVFCLISADSDYGYVLSRVKNRPQCDSVLLITKAGKVRKTLTIHAKHVIELFDSQGVYDGGRRSTKKAERHAAIASRSPAYPPQNRSSSHPRDPLGSILSSSHRSRSKKRGDEKKHSGSKQILHKKKKMAEPSLQSIIITPRKKEGTGKPPQTSEQLEKELLKHTKSVAKQKREAEISATATVTPSPVQPTKIPFNGMIDTSIPVVDFSDVLPDANDFFKPPPAIKTQPSKPPPKPYVELPPTLEAQVLVELKASAEAKRQESEPKSLLKTTTTEKTKPAPQIKILKEVKVAKPTISRDEKKGSGQSLRNGDALATVKKTPVDGTIEHAATEKIAGKPRSDQMLQRQAIMRIMKEARTRGVHTLRKLDFTSKFSDGFSKDFGSPESAEKWIMSALKMSMQCGDVECYGGLVRVPRVNRTIQDFFAKHKKDNYYDVQTITDWVKSHHKHTSEEALKIFEELTYLNVMDICYMCRARYAWHKDDAETIKLIRARKLEAATLEKKAQSVRFKHRSTVAIRS